MIPDIKHYQNEMSKSLADKMFFFDHIWVDSLVDFGCADGALLLEAAERYNIKGVGYDKSLNMLHDASQKGLNVTNQLGMLTPGKDHTLVMSSFLHEVFNDEHEELLRIFRWIGSRKPKHIVIRDMYCSDSRSMTPDYAEREWVEKIEMKNEWAEQWAHFKKYNNQTLYKSIIQFLMKYRFKKNWEHELKEDYLAINWLLIDDYLKILNYNKTYDEKYVLPFIKNQVKTDFDIDIKAATHRKIIYTRNGL
jgi:hypothetical protein